MAIKAIILLTFGVQVVLIQKNLKVPLISSLGRKLTGISGIMKMLSVERAVLGAVQAVTQAVERPLPLTLWA